jgi:hypothetical protein
MFDNFLSLFSPRPPFHLPEDGTVTLRPAPLAPDTSYEPKAFFHHAPLAEGEQWTHLIDNCHVVLPTDLRRLNFRIVEDGTAIISMKGMLICPLEMLTKRQIEMAWRKYRRDHALPNAQEASDG